jgi:hypothetical protein
MGIEYRKTHQTKVTDGFSQIMREAQEVFAGERIQMMGNGINEILAEDVLFQTYKDEMMKGLTADSAMVLEQLIDNTRTHVLTESAMTGIQPITALTMPTLRKSWPRIGVTEAIPTEAVKLPKFSISYLIPWIIGHDNKKHELPAGLRDAGAADLMNRIAVYDGKSTNAAFAVAGPIVVPSAGFDLLAPVGVDPKATSESIDRDFYITEVTVDGGTLAAPVKVAVSVRLETTHSSLYAEVEAVDAAATPNKEKDTLFGKLDRETGKLALSSVRGLIKSVVVQGYVSSEMNMRTEQVGFDVKLKDIDVPTGAHITAPLPIEWLQDTMAMYQIDGAMKVIDIMSDALAQKIDMEGLAFLEQAHVENGMGGKQYTSYFNMKPPVGFTGSPKDWRDEFRTVLDFVAISMKNDTSMTQGKFSILGNDLDTQIIPNVEWVFNNNVDERGGVEVNYSLGAYSGSNRYTVLSTPNVRQGYMYLMYIPTNQDQMTFKYYPYAFAVERANGYLDPRNPNVPSVIMTRRHVFEKFTPLIAKIQIDKNDGVTPLTNRV